MLERLENKDKLMKYEIHYEREREKLIDKEKKYGKK